MFFLYGHDWVNDRVVPARLAETSDGDETDAGDRKMCIPVLRPRRRAHVCPLMKTKKFEPGITKRSNQVLSRMTSEFVSAANRESGSPPKKPKLCWFVWFAVECVTDHSPPESVPTVDLVRDHATQALSRSQLDFRGSLSPSPPSLPVMALERGRLIPSGGNFPSARPKLTGETHAMTMRFIAIIRVTAANRINSLFSSSITSEAAHH